MNVAAILAPRRSRQSHRPNAVSYNGDVATMELTGGLKTVLDANVARSVGHRSWNHSHGYAMNGSGKGKVYLHRLVMVLDGCDLAAFEVDHINGDTLDNRRSNLRLVTRQGNQLNKRLAKGRKYRGVRWTPERGKWNAFIKRDRVTKFLGYFDSETEAAMAYDRAAIAHGGIYRLNFEEERYGDRED